MLVGCHRHGKTHNTQLSELLNVVVVVVFFVCFLQIM